MELIKLPTTIGLRVCEIIKSKGYEPRKNSMGLMCLEFTQEELNLVTELEFTNPMANCLVGIEYLTNLQSLKILTIGGTAYCKENASINDEDVQRISKVIGLKSLIINNQSNVSWVDLDELINLEKLNLIKNSQLDEISGLDKLKKIKDLSIYGNKNLYKLDKILDLINDNELDYLELDLLNYPEVEPAKYKLSNMINCDFVEVLGEEKTISYTCGQVGILHKKCLEIIEKVKQVTNDRRTQIIYIEKYIAENISYDNDGKNNKDRALFVDGKKRGKKGGTNSAYNGIMFGSCVCEGYTRSMQYLLKILGIKTENVSCIAGANKISINTKYHDMISLPTDGYHSIIRIDDEMMLYCDPCWDSCMWKSGNKSLPYCLLTKEEISINHTLSFEEDIISNNHLKIPREYIQYTLQSLEYVGNNLIEKEELDIGYHR